MRTLKGAEMDIVWQFVDRKVVAALLIGAVLGLALGLAIGWWWAPVQWTDGGPSDLRSDLQRDYLLLVAKQRAVYGDEWAARVLAVQNWEGFGPTVEAWAQDCDNGVWAECNAEDATRLRQLVAGIASLPEEDTAPVEEKSNWEKIKPIFSVCGIGLLVLLLLAAVFFVIARIRGSQSESRGAAAMTEQLIPPDPASWGTDGPPLTRFPSVYQVGDDHYDPSFSIELDSGEFMGECGVGVSETIGVGSPNKVTAFEVWLFDKSDIRTVTKVLMSDYAFHDEALRAKLAPKGEPVLAQKGEEVVLETKTLRIRARIIEVGYGMGNLPSNSYFENLTLDLVVWAKQLPDMPADDAFELPPL